MRDPPDPPITMTTCWRGSSMIAGHMEDWGRFPGSMRLAGPTGCGDRKSFISSLKRIPVLLPILLDPKLHPKTVGIERNWQLINLFNIMRVRQGLAEAQWWSDGLAPSEPGFNSRWYRYESLMLKVGHPAEIASCISKGRTAAGTSEPWAKESMTLHSDDVRYRN